MQNILIYGGSFDPPHLGHVYLAKKIEKNFSFERFILLPCKDQVLKSQHFATTNQRIKMLKLAFENTKFIIDLLEIERDSPSYMVESLRTYRKNLGEDCAINLLIGMDALFNVPKWYRWHELFFLCNLLVVNRPGFEISHIPIELKEFINTDNNFDILFNTPAGNIIFYDSGFYDICSTTLRGYIKQQKDIKKYLPQKVFEYIKKSNIY